MTPDDLARAGRALFGAFWQTDVARLLGIGGDPQSGARRIRAMMAGTRPIPPGLRTELAAAMRSRSAELAELAAELDHATPPRSHAQR